MKYLPFLLLTPALLLFPAFAAPLPAGHQRQAGGAAAGRNRPREGRTFTLRNSDPKRRVPEGRVWRVQGLAPYVSEKGVGTADLYVQGQVQLGTDRAYTVNGNFDLLINTRQDSPLWILGGSTVSVGDSRGRVVFSEQREP